MFTMDRIMREGSFIDYGMFLQNVMVAARARGLDTCPQVAFIKYHRVIAQQLQIPDGELIVCGMSLGYADPTRVENSLVTERVPVSEFATFHGQGTE
jgi:nitroreductase